MPGDLSPEKFVVRTGQASFVWLGIGDKFPHLVLVQPQAVGVSSNKFVGSLAFKVLGTAHLPLAPVEENGHELGLVSGLGGLLGSGKFTLWFFSHAFRQSQSQGFKSEACLRHVLGHISDQPVNRVDEFVPWHYAGQLAPA